MLMEREVEFSYKQALLTSAATICENNLDLGEYHIRSGYPAVVGDDASAIPPGQAADTSYSLDGSNRQGATKDRVQVGRGYYAINRKFGTKEFPFLGMVNANIVGAGTVRGLKVEFRTHTSEVTQSTAGAAAGTVGKVEASVIVPTSDGTIVAGSQIAWPLIPRFLTNRYFFLRYVPVIASGAEDPDGLTNGGEVTFAVVLSLPSNFV